MLTISLLPNTFSLAQLHSVAHGDSLWFLWRLMVVGAVLGEALVFLRRMAFPGEAILTDLIRRFVDKTIKEFSYFRHFETLECEFKRVQELWERKLEKAQVDIKDAKRYNQYQNDREIQNWIAEAENWIVEAENLIQNKAEIRSRRLDSCCLLRQFRQGKRLAQKTLTIQEHIQKCNFGIMAGPAELLDMKYHASRDFFDFESRKTEFEQLVKALKDCNIIGLQGMGGTGKTTLATQVGKHVEESKTFEKVVFVVVSNPIDVIKIQGDIAGQLPLRLDKIEEADRSLMLWSSIVKNATKLLIILDDVWEELNLKRIGIPSGPDHKNCYVLITTRQSKVCRAMKCQEIVCLSTLNDEDALRLFLFHAASDDVDSSRNELEGLARDFLKECGGLPLAIVALASTLRNWHVGELNVVLTTLKNSKSFIDVAEDLVEVYSCLKLSYDYLHNEKAQKLFLLCSIFPEDYEFPVNLVIRLVIGLGIFEEADVYCETRTQALAVKNKLIDSSLLQKVEEEDCVKMHDLVREVAQWIAKEDIQVIKDSIITLKTNTRYACWSVDDFPDQFAETNLEILLLWISGNVLEKDPNAFFARMSRLKILFLLGECDRKVYAPSLLKSLLSLKCIQTLILDGWDLGDISILNNLQSLVTLEFKNCQIMELPRNIRELKKLRWLGMRNCEIEKNNPFEVIEKCSQLEEVYFVENSSVKNWNTEDDKEIVDEIAQEKSPAELQIFSIAYAGFERFAGVDNGLLRCFKSKHIKHLISDAMFKNLVRSAQVLELGEIRQSWKNLAPDIIPLENQEVTLCDVPSFISVFENCVLRQPQVSKEDLKEKHANSKASAFSWAHGCCFLALTKHTNAMMEHHTISQEIKKHMQDVTSESAKESELQEIVDVETPLTPPKFNGRSFLDLMAYLQEMQLNEDLMKIIKDMQKLAKLGIRDSKIEEFPMLRLLKIEEASELEQVFIHKQDDMQEMTMMDEVFPKLLDVILRKLPRLVTICEGIDFQNVRCTVNDCPKYQGNNHIQEWSEDGDLENQAATNASPDFAESSKEAMMTSVEEVASSFSKKETVNEIEAKDPTPALLEKQALEGSTTKPQLRSTSLYNYKEIEKEGGKVVPDPASKLAAPTSSSFQSIDVSLKEISEQGPTLEDVVVADLRPRNSSNVTSSFVSQVGGLQSDPSTLYTTTTSPDFVVIVGQPRTEQNLVASMEEKHEQGSQGDDATRKAAKAKGVHEKASTIDTLPMATPFESEYTIEEAGDHSSVQNEAKSEKPIKDILPQVIPSLQYQSQYADASSSSPKLGICEIFRLVELKYGETALLAQALEQYPQLLLPRPNRTHRIIAWSYRVLVDILVMLDTKTPNTITQSEKSTLEANLSEAIVLGFDKDWVESIRAKIFGVDMSDVSTAKEEIQVMEEKLGEIES
ncbi:hypothetical protein K1719_042557 [Acacia pycnantha]|nr:hypothetical protein K1719_042557 [Acacia pycnantha]